MPQKKTSYAGMENVAEQLRARRRLQKLTQWEVAQRAKIWPTDLSHYETCYQVPSKATLQRLAKALGCKPAGLTAPVPKWLRNGSDG